MTVTYGDVDCNGEIDILDVITLNKNLLGKEILDEQAQKNADVDENDKINSVDSQNILKYIVGIVTAFPSKIIIF